MDAVTWVYCAEIFPTHIRSKGMAFSVAIFFLTTIPYLEAAATAFAQIGWKYYLVFTILTVINIGLVWKLLPEVSSSPPIIVYCLLNSRNSDKRVVVRGDQRKVR